MSRNLRVLVAASEAVPFAKTGGLADVAGALPKELAQLKHQVGLVLPKYQGVEKAGLPLKLAVERLPVPISDRQEEAQIYETKIAGNGWSVPVYFVGMDKYYDRPQLYGTPAGDFPDNAERFLFFSRAILEALKALDFKPHIIHCNDWQTGIVPLYLRSHYMEDPFFADTASLVTVHNLGYQGTFWHYDMHLTGLGWEYFTPQGIEFYGKINLLKAGLLYSDVINTVSKKYAQEIQTPELGHGLEGVLQARSDYLYGVLNGIDYEDWNPARDPHLAAKYSPKDLAGKAQDKEDLQKEFNLPTKAQVPLIGIISRLADQKGFDLLAAIMDKLMALDLQLVILGTGEQKYHDLLSALASQYPDKLGLKLAFSNPLAHKIEAGADMFLMPSHYEPCGLNQMYSLKYGTVPVVRHTGGLADTIKNYNPNTKRGNGFSFVEYQPEKLLLTIKKALKVYQDKRAWKALMLKGMEEDFSWRASAEEYVKIYRRARKVMKVRG